MVRQQSALRDDGGATFLAQKRKLEDPERQRKTVLELAMLAGIVAVFVGILTILSLGH